MIKEIKYNSYSAQPSDYECQDGELAMAMNLVPEDGALHPIGQPKVVRRLSTTDKVVFVHKTSAYTHYVIYGQDGRITFIPRDSDAEPTPLDAKYQYIHGVTHINAVGNTLIVFTEAGMNYFLWKDGGYTYLGDHVPEVDLSFGLVGRPRLFSQCDDSKSTFTITFDDISEDGLNNEFTESNKTRITQQVMAKVNKFVREQTIDKGRFCFPFFVRYALRLFDGSLVNHSAPILINPSTSTCPVVFWRHITGKKTYTDAELDIMLVASTLDYKVLDSSDSHKLQTWSDIITGIEIFISKPIYTFDQNGKCTSWQDTDNFSTKFIGRLYATNKTDRSDTIAEDKVIGPFTDKGFLDIYAEWEYSRIYAIYFSLDRSYPKQTLHLPEFTDRKVSETIRNTATFYKLRTIETSEAIASRGKRSEIVVEDDYLQSLVTREVMTDDYLTHDTLAAERSYAFNSRLNLSGISRKPFRGFLGASMFAWCDNHYEWRQSGNTLTISPLALGGYDMEILVYINENGRQYAVRASDYGAGYPVRFLSFDMTDADGNTFKTRRSWGCYVFYPNVNAHKMLISNSTFGSYLISLRPHESLNGAFAMLDYELIRDQNYTGADLPATYPDTSTSGYIPQPNKIFTSEVNNPFYFPLQGINTVGTGRILGICSAAKALSQGQFGQFPLYAFTDEGVWAMELSGTGLYSARQPITRDVCTNPDGITQIDSAVLFPTDRGIMLISGSDTRCISDTINTDSPFRLPSLPHLATLHDRLGHDPDMDKCLPLLPFTEFLKACRMIYDYVHQRIVVYNHAVTYAYVYSLKSGLWGMMHSRITDNVNSYPNALATDTEGNLVDFTLTDNANVASMLVTRPLKLDAPNIHKTIDNIIQRGSFRRGHVRSVLYGSRDLIDWHLVWSSTDHYLRGFRGTPYKYFRMALVCNLAEDESIYGATVRYDTRKTNQPR